MPNNLSFHFPQSILTNFQGTISFNSITWYHTNHNIPKLCVTKESIFLQKTRINFEFICCPYWLFISCPDWITSLRWSQGTYFIPVISWIAVFIFAHTDPEKIQVLRRTFWKPLPPIRSPVDFRLWLRNLIGRNVRPKSITVMTNHMIRNKYWLNCKFSLTSVEYISFCPLLNDCLNLLTNRSMYWEIKQ